MKKICPVIIIILSAVLFISPSEMRMEAMGAKSAIGHYVVPDDWCDTFYINPCFSVFVDKRLINAYSFLSFSKEIQGRWRDTDPGINTFSSIEENYDIKSLNNYGMIIPLKKFKLGFKFQFDTLNFNSNNNYDSVPEEISKNWEHNIILRPEILFAWDITPSFSFGFNIKNNSFIYNDIGYKVDNNFDISGNTSMPVKFDITQSFGFLIKNKKNLISLTIPFSFGYHDINFDFSMDDTHTTDYEKYSKSNYIKIYKTGIKFLEDIYITEKTSFRIQVNTSFELEDNYRVYNSYYSSNSTKPEKYSYLKNITVPVSMAFSVYHKINDIVLLFYGFDIFDSFLTNIYSNVSYTDDYEYGLFENDNKIGLFIGGEFNVLKWLTVRIGLTSLIFNHTFYDQAEPYSTNYRQFSFPLRTNLTAGLAFKPAESFTIEINSGFLYSDIKSENEVIGNPNRNYIIFSGAVGFVFRF